MIFRREMRGSRVRIGRAMMLWRMPSTRKRTRNSFSYGSTWMSEAPAFSASIRIRFETLMIGADSEDLVRSERSISWPSSPLTTSTSAPVSNPVISSMLSSPRPTLAMSSIVSAEEAITSSRLASIGEGPVRRLLRALLQDDRARRPVVLVDRLAQRDLGGDDRLDVVARHELDVVHREHVGRIAHRDRQGRSRLVHREDTVLAGDLAGDDLDDGRIDLEVREVDRRHSELLGERLGDVALGDRADAHERLADLPALLALELQGGIELILRDQLLFEEEISEFYGHGVGMMVGV